MCARVYSWPHKRTQTYAPIKPRQFILGSHHKIPTKNITCSNKKPVSHSSRNKNHHITNFNPKLIIYKHLTYKKKWATPMTLTRHTISPAAAAAAATE